MCGTRQGQKSRGLDLTVAYAMNWSGLNLGYLQNIGVPWSTFF